MCINDWKLNHFFSKEFAKRNLLCENKIVSINSRSSRKLALKSQNLPRNRLPSHAREAGSISIV